MTNAAQQPHLSPRQVTHAAQQPHYSSRKLTHAAPQQPLTLSLSPHAGRGERGWRSRLTTGSALALAATTLTLAACGGSHTPKPTPAAEPAGPPKAVQLAPVMRTGDGGETLVPATVRARRRATLSARISAAVVELPYREGERVAQGALLVRLDAAALESGVAAAMAGVRAAETDRGRVENLLKKNAATPRERDEAEARAAAAQAALSAAKDNLAYAVLRAPFAGTIATRPVALGDVVQPGLPLIEVEGEGGLEVQATVEADLATRLRLGQKLSAQVDGQPAPLDAIVRAVAQAGDPATHRFELRADLPAAPGLRSGLFARLALPAAGGAPRLTIPAAAAFERGGLTGVYVAESGRARLRFIAPGTRSGDRLEVRAGLAAGEQVVLTPEGLADGTPLAAAPAPPQTESR